MYATQAAADADTGAIWTIDAISISGDFMSATQTISGTTSLDASDLNNHIEASGTITITEPDVDVVGAGFTHTIRNAGTGVVTLDGDGAETINGSATQVLAPGDGAIVTSDADNLFALFTRAAHGAKGANIASAATTEIWQSDGELVHITGTTTITSLGTASRAGEVRMLIFDGALTLTDGANLVIQGNANVTTAADDMALVYADTTTKHYVTFFKANGSTSGVGQIADGGTGATTASAAFDALKQTATTSSSGVAELATAAEVKTGTDTSRVPSVSTMIGHEGICKGWINFDGTGTISTRDSFNVSGIVDNGTGDYTVNWNTDFANANYAACITAGSVSGDTFQDRILAQAAGSIQFRTASHTPSTADATYCYVIAIGDR